MSQQINLFNPIFLKQKKYFSAVTMLQALGLIFAGSMTVALYAGYQLSSLAKEAAATTSQLTSAQTQLTRVNAEFGLRPKSKAIEEEIVKTEGEVKALQKVFGVLQKGDFGNTKGYAEYLRAFARQIGEGVWLTGFHIVGAGNEIGLQGRVLQPELVPAYIGRLKREPVMQGKSFASLEMQAPAERTAADQKKAAPYIEFNLQSSGSVQEPAGTKSP